MLVKKNYMGLKIANIAVHHSGGVLSDPYASSLHLTPQKISAYHKQRWNGYNPSLHVLDESLRWAGYNVIYDPKTRTFTQCRAIGEETMAQYGHNFDTFSLCIIGNYMLNPATGKTVDPMTPEIEKDIAKYVSKLISGDYSDVVVVPGTQVSFATSRTHPHRHYQQTNCYGTGLTDKWIQDIVMKQMYPPAPVDADLVTRLELLRRLVALYLQVQRLKNGLKGVFVQKATFGGPGEKGCVGFIG